MVLALDLGIFHKKPHILSFRESLFWSLFWIGLALLFNYAFYQYTLFTLKNLNPPMEEMNVLMEARRLSLEFLTGFLLEKVLSIDNIFVFIIVFNLLNIPRKSHYKVLFYGILGAFIFRALFISLGSWLMQIQWIVLLFGFFLMALGLKCFWVQDKKKSIKDNMVFHILKYFFKIDMHTKISFFVIKKGSLYITPLFVALVMIETTDLVFAFDSVPAIFAITKEPLIVFTSNIFALLGLRAIYFLLIPVMDRFSYLKYGLGLILIFIGLKMLFLNSYFEGHFPVLWSLGFILFVISVCMLLSWLIPSNKNKLS